MRGEQVAHTELPLARRILIVWRPGQRDADDLPVVLGEGVLAVKFRVGEHARPQAIAPFLEVRRPAARFS
jgi:hypothetical protein